MLDFTVRLSIEAASAIACIILARFMIKPFHLTREVRYLGLPIGFVGLSLSYLFAIIFFSYHTLVFCWLTDLFRTFAFVFIAATYYFSKKNTNNNRVLWIVTLSLLFLTLITLSLLIVVIPKPIPLSYATAQMYLRVTSAIFLAYVFIHTLKSHIKEPEPTSIWVPFGFILFAVSQFSFLFLWTTDIAVWSGYSLRLVGLAVFLLVAYRTFYSSKEKK